MPLPVRRRTALASLAAGGALAAAAVSAGTPATAQSRPAYNRHDVTFVQMMLPHHQMAIDMAEIAQKKAAKPAVRHLATKIVRTQSAEVARLRAWLVKMHAQPLTTPRPIEQMDQQDLVMLGMMRGMHVDHMFVMMMRPHHAHAVDESRDELTNGRSRPIRAMAASIRTTQLQEITYMNRLLAGMPHDM